MEPFQNILTVSLQHQTYPGVDKRRFMIYKGKSINLTDKQYQTILEEFPDQWMNEKEKIIRFRVDLNEGENIETFLEVEKTAFDFRKREYVTASYFKNLSKEESNFLFAKFQHYFTKFVFDQTNNFYEKLKEKIFGETLVASRLKYLRDILLKESDVYMLPDFPISDEEREEWKIYRQELRDLTNQDGWPNKLHEINFPVSPLPDNQIELMNTFLEYNEDLISELGITYKEIPIESTKEVIKNISSLGIKMEVLSAIAKMNIPFFLEQGLSIDEVSKYGNHMEALLGVIPTNLETFDSENPDPYFDSIKHLNDRLDELNAKLKEYDLDFSIDDLIKEILEDKKIENEAEILVDSLDDDIYE